MSYHDEILKALEEIDMKVKHGAELPDAPEWAKANKANASYVNTKPTEEDVDDIIKWIDNHEALSGSYESEMKLKVERLWQEIEDLRSILEKQIY